MGKTQFAHIPKHGMRYVACCEQTCQESVKGLYMGNDESLKGGKMPHPIINAMSGGDSAMLAAVMMTY